jgi:nitrate/nitrite transporter NarK
MGIFAAFSVVGQAVPMYVVAPITVMYTWRWAVLLTAVWGLPAAALIIAYLRDKPLASAESASLPLAPVPSYDSVTKNVLLKKPILLVNLAYLGHMWEYLGFNAWLGAFMVAVAFSSGKESNSALVSGNAIAGTAMLAQVAAMGLGGIISDKIGRIRTVIVALSVSAA